MNNSGKSTLLKFFFEFRHLFSAATNVGFLQYALQGQNQLFNLKTEGIDANEVCNNTNDRPIDIAVRFCNPQFGPNSALPAPDRIAFQIPRGSSVFSAVAHINQIDGDNAKFVGHEFRVDDTQLFVHDEPRAYMHHVWETFQSLANTLYIGPFRNALDFGLTDHRSMPYYDLEVGQGFIAKWRDAKTGPNIKDNEVIEKLTEDIRHIFNFNKLEINASADDQTLKLLIDGKSRSLHEVGSGFAQFVIVLAHAALRKPAYILIDEPELNLHPSLQLDFLTTLGSYASQGVIFATHSIGLARSSAENIYAVRLGENNLREVCPYDNLPRLAEFAGELSFSGQHELGFDKILLVEGVTDTKTIQQFLRKFGKDHQVLVMQMGGSLINGTPQTETQLQELKRISTSIYALIDSERATEEAPLDAPRQGFLALCENLNISCHVLKYRAIENYLNDRAVKKVFGQSHAGLGPYQKPNSANPAWPKAKNWTIAREMTREEIEGTDLGKFLSEL